MKIRAFPDKPASFRIIRWIKKSRCSFESIVFKQDIFPVEEDSDLTERLVEKFRSILATDPHIGAISKMLGSFSIEGLASKGDKPK